MARILVAEDSATQAAEIQFLLQSAGFQVEVATDGRKALEAVASSTYDLLVSDVVMPGLTGYELCRRIKDDPLLKDLPVVLLTALSDPMEVIQGLECGADNFLTKPWEADALLERIRAILYNKTRRKTDRLRLDAEFVFMGKKIVLNSDKEQILDLLVGTFENILLANRRLQRTQEELREANAKVDEYARRLEGRVQATEDTLRKAQEQLLQSQKMEAVGRLAGGVAHDFNNLLTVITGHSELALRVQQISQPVRESLEEIRHAAERAASLTSQLLAFSRKQVVAPKVLDLNAVVGNMEKMLRRLIGEDVTLSVVPAISLRPVKADQGQIEQVLMNLAVNARDAMPGPGSLTIETSNAVLDELYAAGRPQVRPGRYSMVSLTDTGAGMTPEVKARLFEPFFTTKEMGKGTGLGLATVYGIVQSSGGHVDVYSEPGCGTTFKVYLPSVDGQSPSGKSFAGTSTMPPGTETVLLVEDEDGVRTLGRHILELCGYSVLAAADGQEAVEVSQGHASVIHLMVSDVIMPHMGGRQLAEQLRIQRPDMKVLFVSGYTDDAVVRHGILEAETEFLQKPYTPGEFARKVRNVLDAAL